MLHGTTILMTVQSEGSPGSSAGTSVSVSSQAPLGLHPRSPQPHLQPPDATRQHTNNGKPPLKVLSILGVLHACFNCTVSFCKFFPWPEDGQKVDFLLKLMSLV